MSDIGVLQQTAVSAERLTSTYDDVVDDVIARLGRAIQ
jgi:hypothetical protein